MPTWTISAPKEFQESVREVAKKLGLSYGAYLRKAHEHYLKSLTHKDFERAKKLMELNQSKEKLSVLRERERLLLREKGYKHKNVLRVLENIEDPDIRKEILAIAKQREEEANKILKVHEELNPTSQKKSLEERRKEFRELRIKAEKEKQREKELEKLEKERRKERIKRKIREIAEQKKREEEKRKFLEKIKKDPTYGLSADQIAYLKDWAKDSGISLYQARMEMESLYGDVDL